MKTDKQQEDLDLPYLTSNQQQQPQNQQQEQIENLQTSQLSSSQSHSSLASPATANKLQASSASSLRLNHSKQVSDVGALSALSAMESPILVAKSASSSSVLSSVSLASGTQMNQRQQQQPEQPSGGGQQLEASRLEVETDQQQLQVGRDPQIQTPKPKINELKRLLRHTNSLNQMPELGVETEHEQELNQLVDQIDVWGLNIFEVHKFSQEHSLTVVMYKIFKVSLVGCT